MRVAVPVWNDRISPVFDVANELNVFTVERGAVTGRSAHHLGSTGRIATISAIGVDVLICAAISRPLEAALGVEGVEVVSEVCGPVDDVVDAYLQGTLADRRLLTPGHVQHLRLAAPADAADGGGEGAGGGMGAADGDDVGRWRPGKPLR